MSWWGKLVLGAVGLSIGGPLGGLIGLSVGHSIDKKNNQKKQEEIETLNQLNQQRASNKERRQAAFFLATFSVMGHVAKADGRVSVEEIELAKAAFDSFELDSEQRSAARQLFNEGKESDFPLWDVLGQFRDECRGQRSLFRVFMDIQIGIALSDDYLHLDERYLLEKIAAFLGFSARSFESMLELGLRASKKSRQQRREESSTSSSNQLDSAYKILDVRPEQTDAEIKNVYRRLMNQYHPDKLVARGLPQEMVLAATKKTKEIQVAWSTIKKERPIR